MSHASDCATSLRDIETGLLRLKWLAAAARFQRALREHEIALKAGFNLSQPRVPAGNPGGGQWTREDWDGSGASGGFDDAAITDFRARPGGNLLKSATTKVRRSKSHRLFPQGSHLLGQKQMTF